jgi:hypothetical protein
MYILSSERRNNVLQRALKLNSTSAIAEISDLKGHMLQVKNKNSDFPVANHTNNIPLLHSKNSLK